MNPTLTISCRVDVKSLAQIVLFLEKGGGKISSGSRAIYLSIEFLSAQLDKNHYYKPTTIEEAVKIINPYLNNRNRSKKLLNALGDENLKFDPLLNVEKVCVESKDEIDPSMFNEVLSKIK